MLLLGLEFGGALSGVGFLERLSGLGVVALLVLFFKTPFLCKAFLRQFLRGAHSVHDLDGVFPLGSVVLSEKDIVVVGLVVGDHLLFDVVRLVEVLLLVLAVLLLNLQVDQDLLVQVIALGLRSLGKGYQVLPWKRHSFRILQRFSNCLLLVMGLLHFFRLLLQDFVTLLSPQLGYFLLLLVWLLLDVLFQHRVLFFDLLLESSRLFVVFLVELELAVDFLELLDDILDDNDLSDGRNIHVCEVILG